MADVKLTGDNVGLTKGMAFASFRSRRPTRSRIVFYTNLLSILVESLLLQVTAISSMVIILVVTTCVVTINCPNISVSSP